MAPAQTISWIAEPVVFPDRYQRFLDAIAAAGHELLLWREDTTFDSAPTPAHDVVVFHGSLGTAAELHRAARWTPGAYCDVAAFHCSNWYASAAPWLLADRCVFTTVAELISDPVAVAADLAIDGEIFVRPDSPLKPFSGRRCRIEDLSLEALDYGYYYDDEHTAVVVAAVRPVTREWRFVVADGRAVAASGYSAERRDPTDGSAAPWDAANSIAARFEAPSNVYVMDLGLGPDGVRLVEINPFSGADLYGCDPHAVVSAVSAAACRVSRVG